jgi:hypothetical protein
MYFKGMFLKPINEVNNSNILDEIYFDEKIGVEIIYFENHEFEIKRNNAGRISEITFANQCTKTHNIEKAFIHLFIELLNEENEIILHESNGSSDILTKEDLEEYSYYL